MLFIIYLCIIYIYFFKSYVQLFSLQDVNYIMCFTINRGMVIQNLNYRCCSYCKFTTSASKSCSLSGICSDCGVKSFINVDSFMIFEFLTAVSLKIQVFWCVTPCCLLNICQRFEGVWCLDLHGHTGHTHCLTLNVEALCFLKTSVTVYQSH